MEKHDSALGGLRVLELADEKGAYCGKLFADMGADVVKIERPGGDGTRAMPPLRGEGSGLGESLFFLYMNSSKRSVTLDITKPRGREILQRLAASRQMLLECFAPGYLEGLGLGYDTLSRVNPGLVFTSITGFGHSGPHRCCRSSDLVASALSGSMYVTGEGDDPPVRLAGGQAHRMASVYAAASSMMALYHSSLSGRGQHVDISVQDAMVSVSHICGVGKWLDDGIVPRRSGAALFASVPSGTYPCRDGLIYLMVNRPRHWQVLARWIHEVTGNQEVLDPMFEGPSTSRQPYRELLDLYVTELAERFSVEEIYHEGQRRHLALTPVRSVAEVAGDPQLDARGYFVQIDREGQRAVLCPGPPYRHSATPWRMTRPAPRAGEHNQEIYCGELGLSQEELRQLERQGVV